MGLESRRGMEIGDLIGCAAVDRDGNRIGRVADVWVDEPGEPRYLGIATGTLGARQITVPLDEAEVADIDGERAIVLPYDRELLGRAPGWDLAEEINVGREREIYQHYGRPGYWEIVDQRQSTPAPTPEIARAAVEDAGRRGDDPRLVRVRRFGR
jgi:hypothetical protein